MPCLPRNTFRARDCYRRPASGVDAPARHGVLMKILPAALLAALALQSAAACAESAAPSPLVGHWALEVDKLPMPPEARPKRVSIEFRDPGAGKWTTHVEIVHPDDSRMHADSTLPLDGTPGAIDGDYWADVATMKMPAANVLVVQLVDDGVPSSTRVYSVAGDNDTLTETKAFFGKDGTPILQTIVFKRVR
jgi:hypothetical protein